MFSKHFTIVLIPRRSSPIRKIKITYLYFAAGLILLIGLISGMIYVLFDYFSIRAHLQNRDKIEKNYSIQEEKINQFQSGNAQFSLNYEHLEALHQKLLSLAITGLEPTKLRNSSGETQQNLEEKIAIAKRQGILEVIASDAAEVDSDHEEAQSTQFITLMNYFKNIKNPISNIPNGKPANGFVSSKFGIYTDPYTGQSRPLNGVEILLAGLYAPVYSPADGIVVSIQKSDRYGNELLIDHGNGFMTRYGHLNQVEVEEGEIVKQGKMIAQVGKPGLTNETILYYEITFNSIPLDPIRYMNQ